VDLNLSEQQNMIKLMTHEFLEKECPKTLIKEMSTDKDGLPVQLWRRMADLHWMGLTISEEYGGSGGSFLDLAVLLEEMGYALVPEPFFSTVVLGVPLIMYAASDEQKRQLLPKIAQGNVVLSLAISEPHSAYGPRLGNVRAESDGQNFILNGTKLSVPYAQIADLLICVVRTSEEKTPTDGITLLLVDGKDPSIRYTPLKILDGSKRYDVTLNKTKVPITNLLGRINRGWEPVARVLVQAALAKCAEMVGAAQRVLDLTVEYSKTRVQFEHLIGSFQAIQHQCANMLIQVDSSRLITYQAAWKLSQGLDASEDVALAKAWVSDAYRQVTALGIQVHGGVGFMEDHELGLYYKNARSAEIAFGDSNFWRQKLVQRLQLSSTS
jgi:alkylation response protein AidB-like acyl-CoA dehydrogenase